MTRRRLDRRRGAILAMLAALTLGARAEDREAGVPATNPLDSVSAGSLSAFRTRPLFAPTRAEAAPPTVAQPMAVAAPPPPPPEPPPLRLVGIIGGATRLAVVRMGDGSKARIITTGDKLDDWSVTILEAGLRLTAGDRTVDIALFNAGAQGKSPLPKPGAPPTEPPLMAPGEATP